MLLRRRHGRIRPRRLHHGAPRGVDSREASRREDHLRRSRELGRARDDRARRRRAADQPRGPRLHQASDAQGRRRVRRRGLGPLLLPRLFAGRLGSCAVPPHARADLEERPEALGDPRPISRAVLPHGRAQHPGRRRAAQAGGAREDIRHGRNGLASRRRVGRLRRLALQRPAVEHGTAPATEPRGALAGGDGAQARRGARRHPRVKARDLGIVVGELEPGALNAITDLDGVRVGHTTLIEGDDVRTGVTVVLPPLPVFAAPHRLNGNGEMTGLEWVRESGELTTPIGITNTHSVGVVRDAIVEWAVGRDGAADWSLPVVAETYDGLLNDIDGFHVTRDHVFAALEAATNGPVEEGAVGGGTGMVCHGFKGGIGTASRRAGDWIVGVLVQANHGRRSRLSIDGVPIGRELGVDRIPGPTRPAGSIIVLVATDAPLLPHQCERVAQRAALGIARTGGAGENSSGDLILAWSTANTIADKATQSVTMLANERIDQVFYAAIEATEEAIVNAL